MQTKKQKCTKKVSVHFSTIAEESQTCKVSIGINLRIHQKNLLGIIPKPRYAAYVFL